MSRPKKEITINDLFSIIKKLDSRNVEIEKKIRANTKLIEALTDMIRKGIDNMVSRLTAIDEGQRDIMLRFDEVAYSFEVKKLARRIYTLERKIKKLETQKK